MKMPAYGWRGRYYTPVEGKFRLEIDDWWGYFHALAI